MRTAVACHEAISPASLALSGPHEIPSSLIHASSVPDTSTPSKRNGLPEAPSKTLPATWGTDVSSAEPDGGEGLDDAEPDGGGGLDAAGVGGGAIDPNDVQVLFVETIQ